MSVIYCYYIIDAISLCELVSVSDSGGLNVKYLEIWQSVLQKRWSWLGAKYLVGPSTRP
jgi:hypothetical protein